MEELDKIWIWNNDITCPQDLLDEGYSKRLGLKNLEGIFIMVAGGILSGIILIIAEVAYNYCQSKKKNEGTDVSHTLDNEDKEHLAVTLRNGSEV